MSFTPLDVLQAFLLLQALLLLGLLLRQRALWPVVGWLAVLAVHMLWNLGSEQTWRLFDIRPGLSFLYGPLLLAMVRRLAWQDQPALRFWQLLPALAAPLLLACWPPILPWIWPVVALTTLAYLAAAFVTLAHYERTLKATHANPARYTLSWLRSCLIGFTVVALADFSRLLLPLHWQRWDLGLNTATYLSALVLVVYLLWRGWQQADAFPGLSRADVALVAETEQSLPGAAPSASTLAAWVEQLEAHMQTQRPQLDPQLSVMALAAQLGWPAKQLSLVLNQHYQRNFNDFINAARVAYACELLRDPQRGQDKLLTIQWDAGFASKSVFHAAFKRATGLTPHRWRKQYSPDSA